MNAARCSVLMLLAAVLPLQAQEAGAQTIPGPKYHTANYELVVFNAGHFALKVGGMWMPGCVCLNVNGVPQYRTEALSQMACRAETTPDGRRFVITGRLTPDIAFTQTLDCTDTAVALTYRAEALRDLDKALLTITAGPAPDAKAGLKFTLDADSGGGQASFPPEQTLRAKGVRSITWHEVGRREARTEFEQCRTATVTVSAEHVVYDALVHTGALKQGEAATGKLRFEAEPIGDAASWVRSARASVGHLRFGVGGLAGLVHNVRTDHGLLLQYLSLNEQDVHQVSVGRTKGTAWGGVKLVKNDPGREVVIEARGKVVNDWTERVAARAVSPTVDELRLTAHRELAAGPQRLRLLMYVAQWLEEERCPFYLHTPDGKWQGQDGGEPLWFGMPPKSTETGLGPYRVLGRYPAGTEIVVPMPARGERLRVRLGQETEISGYRFEIYFRGLWFQTVEPAVQDLDCLVTVEQLPARQIGRLTIVDDEVGGGTTMSTGGSPLLDRVAGFPVERSDRGQWAWREEKDAAVGTMTLAPTGRAGGVAMRVPAYLWGKSLTITRKGEPAFTAVGGVPLRLGSVSPPVSLPAGSSIELAPTALDRLRLTTETPARLELTRGAADLGELALHTADGAARMTVTGWQVSEPQPDAIAARPVPAGWSEPQDGPYGGLTVKRDLPGKGDLTVATPWWEVVHSQGQGGAISSIRYLNGTARNILTEPVATRLLADRDYRDTADPQARIEVVQSDPDRVQLRVTGRLMAEGQALGSFEHRYDYRPMLVRRTCGYELGERKVACRGLSVGSLHLQPWLDEAAARRQTERTTWFQAVFPGPTVFEERSFSQYLCLFRRGVEGIDWVPASDLKQWWRNLDGGPAGSRYAIDGTAKGEPLMVIEPVAWDSAPVELTGTLRFESYHSLPQTKRRLRRRDFVACLNTGECTSEMLKLSADSGVTNVMLGCGNVPGTFELSDQKDVQRVVAAAKQHGLKVYPFDPFQLVNRRAKIWPEHHEEWGREVLQNGRPTLKVYSSYGDYFCPTADGFRQALKDGYARLIASAGFQGNYHDFTHPYTCWNTRHDPVPHLNTDGVLDEVVWERQHLGPDGVFCGHTGWCPVLFFQDLCTVSAIFEEYPASEPLPLHLTPAQGEFVNAAQMTLVSSFLNNGAAAPGEAESSPPPPELVEAYLARCALVGIFPWAHSGSLGATDQYDLIEKLGPWYRLFALRGDWDLASMQFLPYHRQTAVQSANAFVRAATYWNRDQAIIVLANSESAAAQRFTARILPEQLGWPANSRLQVAPSLGSPPVQANGTRWSGELPGFGWAAYRVSRG